MTGNFRTKNSSEIEGDPQRKLPVIFFLFVAFIAIAGGFGGSWLLSRMFPADTACPCNTTDSDRDILLEIGELKNTIGYKEDIFSQILAEKTLSSLVGIYRKKPGGSLYTKDEIVGTGVIVTSDGWILAKDEAFGISKGQRPVSDQFVIIYSGSVYGLGPVVEDTYSGTYFFRIEAVGLPVARFGKMNFSEVTRSVIVMNQSNEVVTAQIIAIRHNRKDIHSYHSDRLNESPALLETFSKGFAGGVVRKDIHSYHSDRLNESPALLETFSKGFAGGVVMNLEGEIVGILETAGEDGYSLIIPYDSIDIALQSLLKKGIIERPVLGIEYFDLSLVVYAGKSSVVGNRGVMLISDPISGTPAAVAGLKEGDIILGYDDRDISPSRDFSFILQEYPSHTAIELRYLRNGIEKKTEVILGVE